MRRDTAPSGLSVTSATISINESSVRTSGGGYKYLHFDDQKKSSRPLSEAEAAGINICQFLSTLHFINKYRNILFSIILSIISNVVSFRHLTLNDAGIYGR